MAGHVEPLSNLAQRYNAGDTIVSFARFENNSNFGKRSLEISNVHSKARPNFKRTIKPSESEWNVLVRGADAVVNHRGRLEKSSRE